MKPLEFKVARIGNSSMVSLPVATLRRYRIGGAVLMEDRDGGIVMRPVTKNPSRFSWEDTAREIQASGEDWRAWDSVAADGLESLPWEPKRQAV